MRIADVPGMMTGWMRRPATGALQNDRRRSPVVERLEDRTFVVGVGAQKAGTTWLRHYLLDRPEALVSRLGEMHYFDAAWRDDFRQQVQSDFIIRLQNLARGLVPDSATVSENELYRLRALIDRLDMIDGGLEAYRAFFTSRLVASHTHVVDITPSYAVLPLAAYEEIRDFHPRVKIVFLMRDPVERLSSAVRMYEAKVGTTAEHRRIDDILASPAFIERSSYEETVVRLRTVFPPQALFFGFYEHLFRDATIAELCDFLGLRFQPGNYDERINEGTQTDPFTPAETDAARKALADTYLFCQRTFGARVPAEWRV